MILQSSINKCEKSLIKINGFKIFGLENAQQIKVKIVKFILVICHHHTHSHKYCTKHENESKPTTSPSHIYAN